MKRLSTPTSLRSLAWPIDTRLIVSGPGRLFFFHCPKSVCTHTETQIHKRKNGGVSNKWSGLAAFLSLEPWDFSPHSETTRQPMGTQGQQVAWPRKPDWNFYLFWFKDTDKAKSGDITKEITAHPQPHHKRIQTPNLKRSVTLLTQAAMPGTGASHRVTK